MNSTPAHADPATNTEANPNSTENAKTTTVQPAQARSSLTATRSRIVGLDVARALAILGMMYAHLGPSWAETTPQLIASLLADGTASAMFALMAGVSLSIMVERVLKNPDGSMAKAQFSLGVRGLLLMAIGIALIMVQSEIYVVLISIGLIFLALPMASKLSSGKLLLLGLTLLAIAPLETIFVPEDSIFGTAYPAIAWLTYGVFGMLTYRHVVKQPGIQWAVLTMTGILGAAGLAARSFWDPYFNGIDDSEASFLTQYFSNSPHSGAFVEILVNTCVSIALLTLCLIACRPKSMTTLLYPVRAVGSMGLTVYVVHIITGAGILAASDDGDHTVAFILSLVVALVLAPLWFVVFRRGPLESLMHQAISWLTKAAFEDSKQAA